MRSMTTTLGALAVGAALMLTCPGTADAATGNFLYHSQPGNAPHFLHNPVDNACYNAGGAGAAQNGTNRDALLYAGSGCRGNVTQTLNPGASSPYAKFASVKFVR